MYALCVYQNYVIMHTICRYLEASKGNEWTTASETDLKPWLESQIKVLILFLLYVYILFGDIVKKKMLNILTFYLIC